MLRERLKAMDLKITELADYMQISRPTMYKFIEYYDSGDVTKIHRKVRKLFAYIEDHELAGKKNVINYILSNLVTVDDMGSASELNTIKKVKSCITSDPTSTKSRFFSICASDDRYDDIINYLMSIHPLLKKKKLTEEEQKKLDPYNQFINKITEEE